MTETYLHRSSMRKAARAVTNCLCCESY